MGKLKYLSKNIALFSISNFVSKILVFLLVPFYTNVLTTYEYGIADVIQVTLLLLVPMVTLNIGEAALRFGVEEVNNRKSIYLVGIKYVLRAGHKSEEGYTEKDKTIEDLEKAIFYIKDEIERIKNDKGRV